MKIEAGRIEQIQELDQKLARELTWRYVVALLLVASLSTAAWFSMNLVITEQESTASVVNISGRQRMLSQRMALLANLLVSAPRAQRPEIRAKLEQALDLMDKSHRALLNGSAELHLPARQSPAVHAMYFEGPDALNSQVEIYLHTVKDLLESPDEQLTPRNAALQYITRVASGLLVDGLNRMVNQYQLEGEQAIQRLARAETAVWLATLLLLLLEAWLIFRPLAAHTSLAISRLQDAVNALRKHEEKLEDVVRQRTLELELQAHSDYLTEVNNRRHFMTLAEAELVRSVRYEKTLSLFMIDIDWFKSVNDLHGHKAGDLVLKKMADIARHTLRAVDIIGRIGGEEFAVILPETDLLGAQDVAERLRAAVAASEVAQEFGLPISITISIGVAEKVSAEDNIDLLLHRADQALYRAKEEGRNRVCLAD